MKRAILAAVAAALLAGCAGLSMEGLGTFPARYSIYADKITTAYRVAEIGVLAGSMTPAAGQKALEETDRLREQLALAKSIEAPGDASLVVAATGIETARAALQAALAARK